MGIIINMFLNTKYRKLFYEKEYSKINQLLNTNTASRIVTTVNCAERSRNNLNKLYYIILSLPLLHKAWKKEDQREETNSKIKTKKKLKVTI